MSDTPFPKAVRSSTTIIGAFVGSSGSGKTMSAIMFALGLVRGTGKRVLVVDTENGRALHYADMFDFDHAPIVEPFRPSTFGKPIEIAIKSGAYGAIVVDNFSHEHVGYGGLQDWHDEILGAKVERARRKAGDGRFDEWQVRESLSVGAWSEPKQEHKKFFQWLLQQNVHVLLCLRAEEKIEFGKDDKGKTTITASKKPGSKDGWVPIAEKSVIFDATFSLLFLWTAPGIPSYIKVQEQHRRYFPTDRELTEESGAGMADWARGGRAIDKPNGASSVGPFKAYADRFANAGDAATLEKAWPDKAELAAMSKTDRTAITGAYKARAKELKK